MFFFTIKNRFEKKINDNCMMIFVFSLIFLYLIHLIHFILHPSGSQEHFYFKGLVDLYADFFNDLIYIADRDPYFNEINGFAQKEYLPLSYVLLYPLSRINNYATMSLKDCWANPKANMTFFIYMFISLLFLLHSMECYCKKLGLKRYLIIGIICSLYFFRAAERGNLIINAISCVFYFLTYYDDENRYKRFFACFMITTASVLKIYPVFFALLYITKSNPFKYYKEIIICIVLGLFLTFLPFLFFKHGFGNINKLLSNIQEGYSVYYPNSFVIKCFSMLNSSHSELLILLFRKCVLFVCFLSLILSIFSNNFFDRLALISFSIFFLPTHAGSSYQYLFLYPLCIVLFSEKKNLLFLVYFITILCPLMVPFHGYILNYEVCNPFTALMMIFTIISVFKAFKKNG